uniref:Transmembrane BAX inhibitor motif-containing protein 6 n=1 Tax=Chelydra serpentina TaxID=8475 RepID=A0A8C3SA19_CHESE
MLELLESMPCVGLKSAEDSCSGKAAEGEGGCCLVCKRQRRGASPLGGSVENVGVMGPWLTAPCRIMCLGSRNELTEQGCDVTGEAVMSQGGCPNSSSLAPGVRVSDLPGTVGASVVFLPLPCVGAGQADLRAGGQAGGGCRSPWSRDSPVQVPEAKGASHPPASAMDVFNRNIDFNALFKFSHISASTQQHLKRVYASFALCMFVAATGAYINVVTHLLRFSLLSGLGSLGLLFWLMATPHSRETEQKRLGILAGFAFLTGANLGPLLEMCITINPSIVPTAFLGTAVIFSCFSLSALYARRRSFLYLGGFLLSGLFLMLLFSLINIFVGSTWLFTVRPVPLRLGPAGVPPTISNGRHQRWGQAGAPGPGCGSWSRSGQTGPDPGKAGSMGAQRWVGPLQDRALVTPTAGPRVQPALPGAHHGAGAGSGNACQPWGCLIERHAAMSPPAPALSPEQARPGSSQPDAGLPGGRAAGRGLGFPPARISS